MSVAFLCPYGYQEPLVYTTEALLYQTDLLCINISKGKSWYTELNSPLTATGKRLSRKVFAKGDLP